MDGGEDEETCRGYFAPKYVKELFFKTSYRETFLQKQALLTLLIWRIRKKNNWKIVKLINIGWFSTFMQAAGHKTRFPVVLILGDQEKMCVFFSQFTANLPSPTSL